MASIAGLVSANFIYDASGRRVSKTFNSATTQFLYTGSDIVQEISPSGAHVLSGLGVSRVNLGGPTTRLDDESGSAIALTDTAGTIQTQYSYGP